MDNETLVQQIQNGDRDKLLELQEQIRGLCFLKARRVLGALKAEGRADADMDDLMQAGYLALVDAVGQYAPEAGFKFSTIFTTKLKTAFAEATGYRSEKQKKDPIHLAGSLDAPLDDQADGDTVGDLVADPVDQYEAADERLYQEWLHNLLASELDKLPPEQRDTMCLRYFRDMTLAETGAALGADAAVARQREAKALRALRRSKEIQLLGAYLDGRGSTGGNFEA